MQVARAPSQRRWQACPLLNCALIDFILYICPKYYRHRNHHWRLRHTTVTPTEDTVTDTPARLPRSPPQGDDAPHRMIHRMIHRRALLAPLCDTGTTEAVILANTRTPL
jgi:hypothetical protein